MKHQTKKDRLDELALVGYMSFLREHFCNWLRVNDRPTIYYMQIILFAFYSSQFMKHIRVIFVYFIKNNMHNLSAKVYNIYFLMKAYTAIGPMVASVVVTYKNKTHNII